MPLPELVALDVAADPLAWRALGFTIDEDGACTVDGVAIRLGCEGRKISGWAVAGVPGGVELDGLPTVPGPPPADPASHANGTVALDHLVVIQGMLGGSFQCLLNPLHCRVQRFDRLEIGGRVAVKKGLT